MRRSRIRSLWRWSWTVTVPLAVAYSLWAIDTWRTWRRFAVDYDGGAHAPSLREVGRDRFHHMARQAMLPFRSGLASVPAESQLPNVQLFVNGRDLGRLDANLPYSGFEYVAGRLVHDDGQKPVEVRYRGDDLAHWAHDKKSLRVKTAAGEEFAGMRAFNLIAPRTDDQVAHYLSYRLAAMLGLVTPRCELVNVFLNGEYRGLHQLTEQLAADTLRRHDRVPGDLWAGDLVGRDRVEGATYAVFTAPQGWRRITRGNGDAARAPLTALLEVVAGPIDEPGQARLAELLDLEAFGRFGALWLLTQTEQYDERQNWRLYWDPWRGVFEPVVWDPARDPALPGDGVDGDEDAVTAVELETSRLHTWLLGNGAFLAARHRALRNFFGRGQDREFAARIDSSIAAAREALARDPNIRPTDPEAIEAAMARYAARSRALLDDVRERWIDAGPAARWTRLGPAAVRIEVAGHRPIDDLELLFRHPPERSTTVELRFSRRGRDHAIDLSAAQVAEGNELRLPVTLFAELAAVRDMAGPAPRRREYREPRTTTYELHLGGLEPSNSIRGVRCGGGDLAESAELPRHELAALFVPAAAAPRRTGFTWRGDVAIEGVREIHGDVEIEAGTTIRLGAGASVLFFGRVTARGEEDRPIRFVPARDGALPWGTVALAGPGCSGSRLSWCELRGGSGHRTPLSDYGAMLSIHDCRDVRIDQARLSKNHRFDDMIHVVYSECAFSEVSTKGALADALDCDASEVSVDRCTFGGSGNDAIDLSMSALIVRDSTIQGGGKDGVKVGARSELIALRTAFRGCGVAVEVGRDSLAHVVNSDIRDCERAFDARGVLVASKSVVLDRAPGPPAGRIVDCLTEQDPATVPAESGPLPFPAELVRLGARGREVWKTVRADRRGIPDAD